MSKEIFDFVSIQLNKNCKTALYVQLYDEIREMIITGKLSHGFLLPPVRKLAQSLEINAGTVMSSYKLLEQNGYIFSRSGSGSYVAELSAQEELDNNDNVSVEEFETFRFKTEQESLSYIDLAGINPDPDLISIEDFKMVLIEVLDRDKGHAFGYQDSQGFLPLRQAIADNLKKQNINITNNNIQVISGAQQGIDIVAKAVVEYGDYVFVEKPTYPGAIAAFKSRGAKLVSINLQQDGLDIEDLENKIKKFRPKLLYIMPNIQNPTGYTYSLAKRNRLMGLARYYNVLILEDDYISDLSYNNNNPAPLKALDRDERIIYLKSYSKIFMPGLRLAFLTVPEKLVNKFLAVKQHSDIATSGLTQRAFDLYLRKGIWYEHINTIRSIYYERYQFTLKLIKELMPPTVKCDEPNGGLALWLELPSGISANRVVALALQQKVLVTAGTPFFVRQAVDRYLRISFALAQPTEIKKGLRIIADIVKKY